MHWLMHSPRFAESWIASLALCSLSHINLLIGDRRHSSVLDARRSVPFAVAFTASPFPPGAARSQGVDRIGMGAVWAGEVPIVEHNRTEILLYDLWSFLFRGACSPARRTALPRVCRSRAHGRAFPTRNIAFAGRPASGRDLVLERLSRHGPALEGDRRHGRNRHPHGRRRGGHSQHFRYQPSAGRTGARARRPARQGSGAGLHLGGRLQRNRHRDHRRAASKLREPLGRLEPQFDDRGRAAGGVEKKIWRHNDVGHLEELLARRLRSDRS
jgi:hypothetical protein